MKNEYKCPDLFIINLTVRSGLCASPAGEIEIWTEEDVEW